MPNNIIIRHFVKGLRRIFNVLVINNNNNTYNVVKKFKKNFSCSFPAFTTVASAIFGRTCFSSHAYAGCWPHARNYLHKPRFRLRWFNMLPADNIGHFGIW